MDDLSLNEPQREAVNHRQGQIVVFASAGSGKTRIITARVASLLDSGVPARSILAVTFTNRAAKEMRERAEKLSPSAKSCVISTFHSACARWLREFANEMGLSSSFMIYDQRDSNNALKAVLIKSRVEVDEKSSVAEFSSEIAKAKTKGIFADDVHKIVKDHPKLIIAGDFNVYQQYQTYLHECDAVDFGDLILNVVFLLRSNNRVRSILRRRFQYIMVDEYQDINACQFELIKTLAEGYNNLLVVGDDDQSIYSWRGANPHNILRFTEVFPNSKKIVLEQNYRSSSTIVRAASTVVANNYNRVVKNIWTANPTGYLIDFRSVSDPYMEAAEVVDSIISERGLFDFNEVAIFYRTNSQSRLLEDKIRRQLIPYRIYGGVRFYDRLEIKDVLGYFRLAANNSDNASFKRIISTPRRGIGERTVESIERLANERQRSLLQQCRDLVEQNDPKLGSKLKKFVETFDRMQYELLTAPLPEILGIFLSHIDYFAYLAKHHSDYADDKRGNVIELGSAIKDFAKSYPDATLSDWLESVALIGDEGADASESRVSLMTLHASKGLEFERVFIVGVEENLLPHFNSINAKAKPDDVEEERRLFYVGMTRAKERLTLLAASRREKSGSWEISRPSRFLREIPGQYLGGDNFLGKQSRSDHSSDEHSPRP